MESALVLPLKATSMHAGERLAFRRAQRSIASDGPGSGKRLHTDLLPLLSFHGWLGGFSSY